MSPATAWQRWLRQPQRTAFRKAVFQIHLWAGIGLGLYVVFISVTGSVLVCRNELYAAAMPDPGVSFDSAETTGLYLVTTLMAMHDNLLAGDAGRTANGFGAIATLLVALTGLLIWWPGSRRWRRSLSLQRGIGWRRFVDDALYWLAFLHFAWAKDTRALKPTDRGWDGRCADQVVERNIQPVV